MIKCGWAGFMDGGASIWTRGCEGKCSTDPGSGVNLAQVSFYWRHVRHTLMVQLCSALMLQQGWLVALFRTAIAKLLFYINVGYARNKLHPAAVFHPWIMLYVHVCYLYGTTFAWNVVRHLRD